MQRREQVVRVDDAVRVRHLSHALVFDPMALAGQQPQDARDDLAEQRLELFVGERWRRVEYGRTFCAGAVDPVEHQTMQVNVKVRSRAEALNEGEAPVAAWLRLTPACRIRCVAITR